VLNSFLSLLLYHQSFPVNAVFILVLQPPNLDLVVSSFSVSVVQFINFFGILDVSIIILNNFPLPGRPINGLLAQVEPSFFIDLHAQQHC